MSITKSRNRHTSRLVKKNITTSRPTDQEVQVSCPTTDKSTILETNLNANAVSNSTNNPTILERCHSLPNAVSTNTNKSNIVLMNRSHSDEPISSTSTTKKNHSNASIRLRSKDNSKIKKEFSSNSVDPISMNALENLEIYPVKEMDKKQEN